MALQWKSHPSSPVKYLHGSPTGSDRPGHPPSHPRHAPGSPAFPVPNPVSHPTHPTPSPDHTPSRHRLQLQDRGNSPYESPPIRRILAPALVDRACSPMPDVLTQQLPLPEILAAVRQQLLEPWAAQQLLQTQSHGDAMTHLQAGPEAGPEADMEGGPAVMSSSSRHAHSGVREQLEMASEQLLELQSDNRPQGPDYGEMQASNTEELGEMHSMAELQAAQPLLSPAAHVSPQMPSDHCSNISSKPSSSAQLEQLPAVAEVTVSDDTSQHSPHRLAKAPSNPEADIGSGASSVSSDQMHQQNWLEQWQEMQQRQQRKAMQARPYPSQPNQLMTKVAAASRAQQSMPIRAIFEHHSTDTGLPTPEDASPVTAAHVSVGPLHNVSVQVRDRSQDIPGLQAVAELFESEAAESAGRPTQHSWLDDDHHSEVEEVCAVQDLPDEVGMVPDESTLHYAVGQEQGGHHDRHSEATEDIPQIHKRSLTPAADLAAHESSGDTSPEAARNSRMKVRRTSGEYQQVKLCLS